MKESSLKQLKMNNRVIIAGSRSCPEECTKLFIKIRAITKYLEEDMEIVSGCAKGADRFGENYAKEMVIPLKQFPADWDKYGKSAGYIRNKQMAEYATHLIALWDGESKGTKHMIDLAKQYGLKVRVIKI